MADQGGDVPEGAEGGHPSSDEFEYELVAEEEYIDTAWESAEVHPEREFPRVGFGRSGQHPGVPPPRVYLTDRPTSASPSRGVQTSEPPQEQLVEQERPLPQQQEQGGQAAAARQEPQERPPLSRRISERLQRMRLRSSRDESPTKKK